VAAGGVGEDIEAVTNSGGPHGEAGKASGYGGEYGDSIGRQAWRRRKRRGGGAASSVKASSKSGIFGV